MTCALTGFGRILSYTTDSTPPCASRETTLSRYPYFFMEVPADITTRAFFPGSFSVASLAISPHPNSSRVGMKVLKVRFDFIML